MVHQGEMLCGEREEWARGQVASASATEPFFPSWTELLGNNRLASQVRHPLRDVMQLFSEGVRNIGRASTQQHSSAGEP
jgi:hypothetical protein